MIAVGIYLFSGGIELTGFEVVTGIEMEQINEGYSIGVVVTENYSDIEIILAALSRARKASLTWYSAADDTPQSRNYLVIQIHTERGGGRFYLYTKGYSDYVYAPYVGIYRIDRKTSEEIYQMYTTLLSGERMIFDTPASLARVF
ncbi:MAG: DUF5301 domain-containing protein [Treponema sp.]|jgi:hypothetical protein|nr:DUF5301 domain-containing protein [Treponema sp.]